MEERYLQLDAAAADWFERLGSIPLAERHDVVLLVRSLADKLEPDTALLVPTGSGRYLRIEQHEHGKVLVKILGGCGGVAASFSFVRNDATEEHGLALAGLAWEQNPTPPGHAVADLDPAIADESIESLGLDAKVQFALFRNSDVRTIGDLIKLNKVDLLAIHNIGPAALAEIERRLALREATRTGLAPRQRPTASWSGA